MFEGWWAAVVVASVWAAGAGGETARMWQLNGLALSSSTLEWVDVNAGQPLPAGALQAGETGGSWCRFTDHGVIAGVVRDGECHAPFLNSVTTSRKYEALVSINDSARLLEKEWSRPAALSAGGVQVSKRRLLALVRTAEGVVLPGFVDLQNRRAYVLHGDKAEQHEQAVILTEEEPVRYEVEGVVWDEARAVQQVTDRGLLNVTLENPEAEAREVAQEVEYTVTEELYWGNVRGTVKGVTATVTGPGGQVWEVTWGDESRFERVAQQKVSLEVPGGAFVNVSLMGVMHKYEAPYTGQLTAVYKDEVRRARPVAALHHHYYLAELRADYGRPHSLQDGHQLEGAFPTSEVLIASTTTTSTTTTTPAPPGTDPGPQQAGSLATPDTSPAPAPVALTPTLLVCCLLLLLRLSHP